MRKFKGFFITFEGGEHLGKTTQVQKLLETLELEGYRTAQTFEPGGTPVGREIRKLTHNPALRLSKATMMFLMQADRAQDYKDIIKPAMERGDIVIADRFFDSSLAYQGYGMGWKLPLLYRMHAAATGMLLPDITFVFDGEPFAPLQGRDTMETFDNSFHEAVKVGYRNIAATSPRYVLIDANQPESVIAELILVKVREGLEKAEYKK